MGEKNVMLAAFTTQSKASMGAWSHPSSDLDFLSASYYVNMAKDLERRGFDMIFFDDRLALPGAYGGSVGPAVERGARAVKLDLMTILGAIASHTSTIGLGATYSTTYYHPFHVARAFATLDHLSGGRAVWNIVTSLNQEEAENFGADYLNPDERYDRADEFLEVATGLWESWDADALVLDRASSIFANPESVHELGYDGKQFSSRGPLTVPRPPQGWPVLLQAGQSGRGVEFGARWSDLMFSSPRSIEAAREQRTAQRTAIAAAGRNPDDVRILPAVMPFVAETAEIARAKEQFFQSLRDPEEQLIYLSEMANIDLGKFSMDANLDDVLDAVTGTRGLMEGAVKGARDQHGPDATLRDLGDTFGRRSGTALIGTGAEVVDQMEEWLDTGAADGFAILPADIPGTFESVSRLVIPELRRRGLKSVGEGTTFRERAGLPGRVSR